MADEPSKPFDRDKPFKRINNDEFLKKLGTPPDGNGVARGCHIPSDFGEFDKEFEEFVKKEIIGVGPLFNAIETVLKVINTLLDALSPIEAILEFAAQKAEELKIPGAPEILRGLKKVAGVILAPILGSIRSTLKAIIETIRDAFHKLFEIIGRRIMNRAIRMIPQWVPVAGSGESDVVVPEEIVEVEGIATRSYGNPIDVPFFNWHFWFNWNVQVQPEPQYANILTPGLPNPTDSDDQGSGQPVLHNGSFEIQWDAGALASDRSPYINGFPENQMDTNDGPITTNLVCWPMTGMFVWAAGRWVYDCSQATPGDKPQMRTMMNPPKALATARFQAFKFDENTFDVPAIQFMFLAAASGGYISYKSIKDTDYEFIVDLPLLDFRLAPFPIGHTPEFPHNTIVLRPRLLKKVEQLGTTGAKLIQPIVELLPPQGTTQARQVKVTVPMSQLSGDPNAAGFLLSMGWSDPVGAQANKVKRCVLEIAKFAPKIKREDTGKILKEVFKKDIEKLKQEVINKVLDFTIVDFSNLPPPLPKIPVKVTVRDIDNQIPGHPVQKIVGDAFDLLLDALANILPHGDEEWQLHYGFNGHWKVHFQKPVNANKPVPFPLQIDETDAADKFKFDVRLAEGDVLFFAANGMELQPLGDMMRSRKDNRVITLNDKVVVWKNIVSPPPDAKENRRNMVFQYVKKVMLDSTSTVAALGMDNSPLGYIDPNFSARGSSKNSNPMVIKDPLAKTDATQRANFARAIGEEAIVVEDSSILDYEITYHIEIKDLLGK